MSWRDEAPCRGVIDVFYREDTAHALALCGGCHVRRECGVAALEDEAGQDIDIRFGINAAMTPGQRWSLEKRGTARCGCGHVRDPLDLVQGHLVCAACEIDRWVTPIPAEGDMWTKRHTKLARSVLAWVVDHVAEQEPMPTPTALARQFETREQDMSRVYEELTCDGTLSASNGKRPRYKRVARVGAATSWQPTHLR